MSLPSDVKFSGENGDRVHNLWMSDETHFHLSGFVNKQNFQYWSIDNHTISMKHLSIQKK